ncbi:MAG: aromatic/alkene monooxygenase hydroxylase subunit beta [Candidatus Velthaea sp.]|jgi:phenol hydroxylase P1 protein
MSLDIKTIGTAARRHTYANVARRIGGDKPASRYQEATFDMQASVNFHYKPLWDERFELHDKARTAIVMNDWYALLDPRQFYYGTYTQSRAKLSEQFDRSCGFVEKLGALDALPSPWREMLCEYLLPLRHYEWGANMNNCRITDEGYGTAITQATMYATMDRLGLAQMISRIGLLVDGNTGDRLAQAKQRWMDDAFWQPMRRLVEDTLVVSDWFELLLAQDFVMDGLVYPLWFTDFDERGRTHDATAMTLLGEAFLEWFADTSRWIDAVLKVAAAESDANRALLSRWFVDWRLRAVDAVAPLADEVLDAGGEAAVTRAIERLNRRAVAVGLTV